MKWSLPEASDLMLLQLNKFSPLSGDDWQLLLPHLELKELKKHDLFIKEGKKAHEIGFVLEGSLRQYYTRDGEEKTTYFFFEGHLICGYVSCITGAPSLLTIEALSPLVYISFPYPILAALYEQSMAWQKFGRAIAEYIGIGLEERMVGLLMQSPEERYIALLTGNKQKILERIPQHYIANYLGITPVSMSRIRNRVMKAAKP